MNMEDSPQQYRTIATTATIICHQDHKKVPHDLIEAANVLAETPLWYLEAKALAAL